MVKRVYTYKFSDSLFDNIYCPTCKSKLKKIKFLDIFFKGLECSDGEHRFIVELKTPLSPSASECSSMKVRDNKDLKKNIVHWLSNYRSRSHLNNQLAEVIRRIYEIWERDLHIQESEEYKYCLFCEERLFEFKPKDAWVRGLKCKNGHEFFQRNGISFLYKGKRVQLWGSFPDKSLNSLIDIWLSDNKYLKMQLHDQIREVLLSYKNRKELYPCKIRI